MNDLTKVYMVKFGMFTEANNDWQAIFEEAVDDAGLSFYDAIADHCETWAEEWKNTTGVKADEFLEAKMKEWYSQLGDEMHSVSDEYGQEMVADAIAFMFRTEFFGEDDAKRMAKEIWPKVKEKFERFYCTKWWELFDNEHVRAITSRIIKDKVLEI